PDGAGGPLAYAPAGSPEPVVAAHFPFRGELGIGLVVPLPCRADRARPIGNVVGVDALPGPGLDFVQVPERAGDRLPAMPCRVLSGDAFDVERDDARVHGRGDAGLNMLQAGGRHAVS